MTRVLCILKTNEGGLWAIPQMQELSRRGHDVLFLIPPGNGRLRRTLQDLDIPVVEAEFDFRFNKDWRTIHGVWRLRRQIRRISPDIIFYHLYASALAARISTVGLGVRRVHMVAGPLYLDSRVIRSVERILARLDHTLIAGSRYTAARYKQLGYPANRLHAIPYGVDLERFDLEKVEPETSLQPDTFNAVMVAYFYAPKSQVYPGVGIKGHEILLNAWSKFVEEVPGARLTLVGAGFGAEGENHRRELMAVWTDRLPSVRWIDSVDDVRPWYAGSAISISPSLSENHGAALEASAMACPSIVSNAGALPETVDDGATGWIFPTGDEDALLQSIRAAYSAWQTGDLNRMGQAARRKMAASFSQRVTSSQVARAILGPKRTLSSESLLTFFAEDRLTVSERGVPASAGPEFAAGGWARGLRPVPSTTRLAARVSGIVTDDHEVQGNVFPLPSYTGGRQLLQTLPRMTLSILRAVKDSDAIAVRLPGPIGTIAVLCASCLRRNVVIEVVGDIDDVIASGVGGAVSKYGRYLAREATAMAVRRANRVRYVTSEKLQEKYPPAVTAEVYAFSDVHLQASDFERSPKFNNEPLIVAVGSHEQLYKGHDLLIKAMPGLISRFPKVRLLLIGKGQRQEYLRNLASSLNVSEHVEFGGFISPREALLDQLENATVFAMPSRTEGMPRALIEAMALALPCVASDVGGMGELLPEEYIVPPDDVRALTMALKKVLGDRDQAVLAGIANREKIRSLLVSWRDTESRWKDLLEDLSTPRED